MPVFRPMQAVLHEQYPTGAAGGGAAPQGRGGYLGSNIDASGIITPPSPLEEPQAAVRRAMSMIGINPGNISPLSNAIRKKATALVNQLVVNTLDAGGDAADALEQPAKALGMLADLLRQGVSGGKIFGGKGEDTMGRIASLAEANSMNPGASPGAALAASILSNPDQAATIFLQGKYGGLAPQGLAAMTTSLQGIMNSYMEQIEGNPASASNPAGLLRTLLGQPAGGGLGAPTDATGAPLGAGGVPAGPAGAGALAAGAAPGAAPGTVPSLATPASPAALTDPVALMMLRDKQRAIAGWGASPSAAAPPGGGPGGGYGLAIPPGAGQLGQPGGGGGGFSAPGWSGGQDPFAMLQQLAALPGQLAAMGHPLHNLGALGNPSPAPYYQPNYGVGGGAYSGGGAY